MLETLDGVEGVRERHAVGEDADALLEELDGRLGVHAVDAVRLAAREAQDVEALLELAHVVAVEVGETQVEGAVAELVALVNKGDPCGGVDLLAEREPVVEAEARDGGPGGRPKARILRLSSVDLVAERFQALLNVLDRGAASALQNRFHCLSLRT